MPLTNEEPRKIPCFEVINVERHWFSQTISFRSLQGFAHSDRRSFEGYESEVGWIDPYTRTTQYAFSQDEALVLRVSKRWDWVPNQIISFANLLSYFPDKIPCRTSFSH